jgi:hypothetical protein
MAEEIFFDLIGGGCIEGFPGQYGAGRIFFDADTRAFLRIEPPGGLPVVDTLAASLETPVDMSTDAVDTQIVNGG